jgi:hypothetical protein
MAMPKRPSFPETYAKALGIAAKKRGWRAYIRLRPIFAAAIGAAATWFMPVGVAGFWADASWGVSATVFGGVLAFNAILLAVGWSAFAKIYDVISAPDFSAFLKRHNILDVHLMFVTGIHFALAAAALISFAALIGLLLPLPLLVDQILFGLTVATSVNGIVEAFRATGLMNDLIWDKVHSDERGGGQPNLRSVGNGD